MNILLLRPKSKMSGKGIGPPLGLLYLVSSLKSNGFNDISLIDLTFSRSVKKDVEKTIRQKNPAMVGVTANSHDRFQAFNLIKLIKKINPNTITVLGGPHATLCPEETIHNMPELDVLVVGDGEVAIVELAEAVQEEQGFSRIKGIYYRDRERKVIKNFNRPIEMGLDKYPFPDWGAINIKDYDLFLPTRGKPKAITLISSRGCPFRCNFCAAKGIGGGVIRFRSVENIVSEIKVLLRKFPGYYIFIYDDHFLLDKKRILGFCKRVKKEKINFKWGCYGRVDSIDEQIVREISKIGCQMVSFGVESGSKRVLKLMNKGIVPRQIRRALQIVKKYGISVRSSVFFNYPGERIIDIFKTFWLLWKSKLSPDEIVIAEHTLLYPKTKVFERLKNKYLPQDFNWNKKYKNLPEYKNVPIYIPPFDFLRVRLIRFLRKLYKLCYKLIK